MKRERWARWVRVKVMDKVKVVKKKIEKVKEEKCVSEEARKEAAVGRKSGRCNEAQDPCRPSS